MNLIAKLFIIIALPFIAYFSIKAWNLSQIEPSAHELELLKKNLGDIKVANASDLLKIQNKLVGYIKQEQISDSYVSLDSIFKYRKGFCYDRSLVLQKLCIYNGYQVRPVFLYFRIDSTQASIFDLVKKGIPTHNIFEVKMYGKWYMVQTNKKQEKMKTLDEYLSSGISVPKNTRYIRHLNNRNGRFIAPSFIPDIY